MVILFETTSALSTNFTLHAGFRTHSFRILSCHFVDLVSDYEGYGMMKQDYILEHLSDCVGTLLCLTLLADFVTIVRTSTDPTFLQCYQVLYLGSQNLKHNQS